MRLMHWTLVIAGAALGACGGKDEAARGGQNDMGGMAMDSGPTGSMKMGGGMEGVEMMSGMRAHMDSMMRMPPERMRAMMAMHDRMMAQMMDRMDADMRGMNMAGDREWNTLADSIRHDLAELPGLQGNALTSRMRAHADLVSRLLGMHERMTGSMEKR